MNPWSYDALMPAISEVDTAFVEAERTFGVGRLETLVSPPTLAAYRRGWTAWRAAIESGDVSAVEAVGPKMVVALRVMAQEALARGHKPLDTATWEFPMADGSVLVVCRTKAEASDVIRNQQAGRALVVYSMEELATLLPKVDGVHAIKQEWPGATVQSGAVTREGDVADWVRNDPTRRAMEMIE